VTCFLAAGVLDFGRAALLLSAFGSTVSLGAIFLSVKRRAPSLLLPRFAVAAFIVQGVSLLFIPLLGLDTVLRASTYAPDMADAPLVVGVSLLAVPAGILIAVAIASAGGIVARGGAATWRVWLERPPPGIEKFLILAAVVLVLYWFADHPSAGPVGYVVRIIAKSLILMPLIAGRYATRCPRTSVLWIVAMVINAAFGLALGSRFVALVPVVLFAIGYVSQLRGAQRRIAVAACVALAGPVILISGAVGMARVELGRGGIDLLSRERAAAMADHVLRTVEAESGNSMAALGTGIRRMLIAPNIAVPLLTPETVPSRGWQNLGAELISTAEISGLSGRSREEFLQAGLGVAPAAGYGFLVNTRTAVEFGIVADGWSRGGLAGAVLYGFIFGCVLIALERIVRQLAVRTPSIAVVLLTVASYTAFMQIGGLPLASVVRAMVLAVVFMGVLAFATELMASVTRPRARSILHR
jgi:hypothetical protein